MYLVAQIKENTIQLLLNLFRNFLVLFTYLKKLKTALLTFRKIENRENKKILKSRLWKSKC